MYRTAKEVRLPRMRGDRPLRYTQNGTPVAFTPHARGSTFDPTVVKSLIVVYPACAGIVLDRLVSAVTSAGLPRMRGDRPHLIRKTKIAIWFTPHARGSTGLIHMLESLAKVYPACAGIDRLLHLHREGEKGLPRMRGDRPLFWFHCHCNITFTPHARGSTLRGWFG